MFTLLTVLDEAEYVSYTRQKLKAKLMAWFRQQLTFWLPQPTCNSELVFSSQLDIGEAVETAFDACISETKILHEAAAILHCQIKQVHSSAADMQILMHVTFVMFDYDDTGEIKQLKPILQPITAYRTMLLYRSVSWRRRKWWKAQSTRHICNVWLHSCQNCIWHCLGQWQKHSSQHGDREYCLTEDDRLILCELHKLLVPW